MAVSYTHLDVYKRQAFCRLDHPEHHLTHRPAFLGMANVPQILGLVGTPFGTDRRQVVEDDRQLPVSYTHLDVYKRQNMN